MDEEIPAGFAIFLMILGAIVGIGAGMSIQTSIIKTTLIKNNMAEYVCDPSTGKTTFYILNGTNRFEF